MKVTEASVGGERRTRPSPRAGLPAIPAPINTSTSAPIAALVLIVGGAGALFAPSALPFPADVVAIGAVALGGWLVGRRPDAGAPTDHAERLLRATLAERQEVIRAALALTSLSRSDDGPERARRAGLVATAVEPREDGSDDRASRRSALRALAGAGPTDETLDPGADADVLAGGPSR